MNPVNLRGDYPAGAQFHAINTKGTGATNGRVSPSQNSASDETPQVAVADRKAGEITNRLSMNVTVARAAGGLSFTVGRSFKNKNGHVTLNRLNRLWSKAWPGR